MRKAQSAWPRAKSFLPYSDGITEPENDYGEFGEDRLIDLVRSNRHLPLERISEIVTSAVYEWIGANEQPDDVTLRPRASTLT